MAISKEMENWFLRGGKRPETNGMQETLPEPPDEIPVDDDEDDEDGDDRTFSVKMERTRTIRQTVTVRVKADCEESAMDHAEELAEDESDDWDWKDIPDTADYEDCEAVEAEEE